MPTKETNNEETVFNEAFDEAAKKRPEQEAEAKSSEAEGPKPIVSEENTHSPEGPETGQTDEILSQTRDEDTRVETDNRAEPGPDYKSLYEREVQRFKSFEGRYRKEKAAWERERRGLIELLERETGAGQSPASGNGEGRIAGQSSGARESAGQPPLAEIVRQEAGRLIEPLMATIEAERHRNAVAAAHPDFERIASDPDLHAWIDEQPDYIARGLRDVVDRGAAAEVIDMLDRYKRDRDKKQAGAQAEKNKAEAARKAREAAAVRSRSGGPPKERPDADDFAGAWAEAVRKGLRD